MRFNFFSIISKHDFKFMSIVDIGTCGQSRLFACKHNNEKIKLNHILCCEVVLFINILSEDFGTNGIQYHEFTYAPELPRV
jgi:hypothetical protein